MNFQLTLFPLHLFLLLGFSFYVPKIRIGRVITGTDRVPKVDAWAGNVVNLPPLLAIVNKGFRLQGD